MDFPTADSLCQKVKLLNESGSAPTASTAPRALFASTLQLGSVLSVGTGSVVNHFHSFSINVRFGLAV